MSNIQLQIEEKEKRGHSPLFVINQNSHDGMQSNLASRDAIRIMVRQILAQTNEMQE